MFNRIIISTLLLLLTSCGYEAIHSKKNSINYDFSIKQITLNGDRDINLKIKQRLNNYTLTKKDKNFTLKVSTITDKAVLAKNTSGDPTSFKNTIIVNVEVLIENNFKNNLQITEGFNYNNNDNKFNLTTYEKEITKNLTETTVDKLIFKLSNIQ